MLDSGIYSLIFLRFLLFTIKFVLTAEGWGALVGRPMEKHGALQGCAPQTLPTQLMLLLSLSPSPPPLGSEGSQSQMPGGRFSFSLSGPLEN